MSHALGVIAGDPAAMGPCLGGRENQRRRAGGDVLVLPQWGPALEAGRIRRPTRPPTARKCAAMGPCLGGRENLDRATAQVGHPAGRNGALPWRQGESDGSDAIADWPSLHERAAMGPCLGGRENSRTLSRVFTQLALPQWGPALEAGRIVHGPRGTWRQRRAAMGPCLGGRENPVSGLPPTRRRIRPQWGPALEAGRIRVAAASASGSTPAAMGPCLGGRENIVMSV